MNRPQKLYKTTIVIWSKYPGDEVEITHLAEAASSGDAYCSKQISEEIEDYESDPDWDGTEFFGDRPDEEEEEDALLTAILDGTLAN